MSSHTEQFSIPVPEPDLTVDDLVARAAALKPMLRAEQAATEARGGPSPEVHEAIRGAGLYRALQPRRFGGYELTLSDFCRLVFEIASGCPSTGWYYTFTAGHTQLLAELFDEQAQIDNFGPDGEFLAPGRVPMGTAIPVDGGWRVNGTWDYCSGALHSTHFLPSVLMPPADDPTGRPSQVGTAVIPRSQYTVLDDWGGVIGLRGSGSQSIVVDEQVVPEHWVVRYNLTDIDVSVPPPGWEVHHNPQYAGRLQSLLLVEIGSWAVGVARGALDEFARMMGEEDAYLRPGVPRSRHDDFQRHFGVAYGMIGTAEAAVLNTAREHREISARGMEGGAPFSLAEDMTLKMRYQQAISTCWQAVDLLFSTAGVRAARDDSPIQRYYRDFLMARTHVALQYEQYATSFAMAHFNAGDAGSLEASAGGRFVARTP